MHGSLTVGKIWGIPIRIHWSFALLALFVVLTSDVSRPAILTAGLLWLVAVFASVLIHELAHCVMAKRQGLAVRDVVLFALGGVSEIPDIGATASSELRIAIVGPLTSMGIAVALAILGALAGARLWPPTLFAGSWFARLMWVNLLLATFNFLPALPLDGGRVFRAAISTRQAEPEATLTAVRWAKVLGSAMIVIGLFYDLLVSLIGIMILMGAQSEGRVAVIRHELGGRRAGDVMLNDTRTLSLELSVAEAAPVFDDPAVRNPRPWRTMPVVDASGHYVGMLSDKLLSEAFIGRAVVVGLRLSRSADLTLRRTLSYSV